MADHQRLNGHVIIKALVLAAAACQSELCLAFPENARHGYAACDSCHVSPTGGGALSAYGRGTSAALLSTWGSEKAALPFYGLPLPGWLAVGGDQRYLRLASGPQERLAYQTIPMQQDLELAVWPTENIAVAASWGVYGPDLEEASRRHYLLLRLGEHVTARGGRFFAAYGIQTADHSTYVRRRLGFDEGKESVNFELGAKGSFGDLYVTSVYGEDAVFSADKRKGYDTDTEGESGVAVRGQLYLGEASVVGLSCLSVATYETKRQACGAHAVLGLTSWLYALGEADYLFQDESFVASGTLAVEPVQGLHLKLSGETAPESYRTGYTLQWFPYPHWELELTVRREVTEDVSFQGFAVLHHYL